jgi:NADPH:quinone reductase-like Zn-dependent oxidoreductase
MWTMKAVVLTGTCAASELRISAVPVPEAKPGWVLVRVRAFGLNHSEVILRSVEADAPYIGLPRIPGIECAGEIEDPSDSGLRRGQKVVALMGGMGRSFDGSYAEYALLPSGIVFPVDIDWEWSELAAVPETHFTVYTALFDCLQLIGADSLLIRGATSAAGMAAIQLAKSVGCTVLASSRRPAMLRELLAIGADHALLDDGSFADQVRGIAPAGVSKVLELVGPATLLESIRLLSFHGIACDVGVLGKQYVLDGFDPIKDIPNGVYLCSFYSNHPTAEAIGRVFAHLRDRGLRPLVSRAFRFDNIAQAHELLESGRADGKIVVVL